MVRSVALFALVFLLGGVAGGATMARCRRDQPGVEQGMDPALPVARRVGMLAARLGLRADQRAQVEALMTSYHRRFATRAHAMIGADPELAAARQAMHDQLRAILDDDQRQRFDELTRDGGGPMGGGPMGPMGGGPMGDGPPWRHGGPP